MTGQDVAHDSPIGARRRLARTASGLSTTADLQDAQLAADADDGALQRSDPRLQIDLAVLGRCSVCVGITIERQQRHVADGHAEEAGDRREPVQLRLVATGLPPVVARLGDIEPGRRRRLRFAETVPLGT